MLGQKTEGSWNYSASLKTKTWGSWLGSGCSEGRGRVGMEVESCELRMKLWAAQVPDGLRRMFVENQGDHETDGKGEQCEQGVLWKRHRLRDMSMACRPVETVSSASPVSSLASAARMLIFMWLPCNKALDLSEDGTVPYIALTSSTEASFQACSLSSKPWAWLCSSSPSSSSSFSSLSFPLPPLLYLLLTQSLTM